MKHILVYFLIIIGIISGCHKIFEKPKWQTDVKAPLIKTTLGIENIIKDTSKFRQNADKSVKLVDTETLYDFNIDSLASIAVAPYVKDVKLSTLQLDSQTITRTVSLGELALAMSAQGDTTGDYIIHNNNKWTIVPPMSNLKAGPIDVDIQQFFEDAQILTGTMEITLTNHLPVNITNVEFELRNKIGGQQITDQIYSNLNVGSSQTHNVDLSGKTVEGVLVVNVLDMDLGGGFVKIDTSDAIVIQLKVSGITVSSATAIFPAQNVVDDTSQIALTGLSSGVQLTYAKLYQGSVEADAYSTSEDTVFFTYTIPSATLNGVPFVMNAAVPPPQFAGDQNHRHFSASFDGYELDLTGLNHDTINAIGNIILGRIKYTGKKVHLSLSDSFMVTVKLSNVLPSYVKGFFGNDTVSLGSGSVNLDVFKKIKSGTLNFDSLDIKANLIMENGLGIDGTYQVNELKAINSRTGQTVTVISGGSPLSGTIHSAGNNPGVGPILTYDTISLTKTQAVNMLNILPDKINYTASAIYNPGISPPYDGNFAYRGYSLKPTLSIEIPLSVIANSLVLSDTATFVSENFKTSVNSGTFTVIADNDFPVSGDLRLYFLDSGGSVVDSVVSVGTILPAPVDASNKVTSKMTSKVNFYVDQNKMQNILHSRQVVFNVSFSTTSATTPANSFVKIYSDYTIDFKLVGDFNYTVE